MAGDRPAPQILFRLGGDLFALPLGDVHEVVLPGPLSRVPRARPPIAGAMNLRGRIVAVVDLGLLLGRPPAAVGAAPERMLVLESDRRDLAFLVTEVVQISGLGSTEDAEEPGAPVPVGSFTGKELAARVAAGLSAEEGGGPRMGV